MFQFLTSIVRYVLKVRLKYLFVIFCIFFGIQTNAQKFFTEDISGIVNFHTGYNLPEYSFISSLTEDYIHSIDVCFYKETNGKNIWEQLYKYPNYGVSVFYSSLGNDDVFGRELAIAYFVKLYFFSRNRFHLYNRTGIGLSYVNRKFDLQHNYLNVAVGSNVNIHFNFRIGAKYDLSEKFSVNAGLSFNHFSNGNTSEPNLGINYLTGYGGICYSLSKKSERQLHEIPQHKKENQVIMFASIGGKHSRALVSDYFFTSSFSIELSRSFTRMIHFGIGTDLFYDSSVESSLTKNEITFKPSDCYQTGFHLSQSLVYNKFSLSIQEGMYFFLTEKVDHYTIYNRGILQYQITKNLAMRISMKSHLHILDYPEIGLGYRF